MKITFLGTSGMVPTKDRNVQSIYLDYNGEGILFDCGEGTQRQITLAKLNAQKIKKIIISHWHGDHVLGLPGLIQTLGNFASEGKEVTIYGPSGSKKYFNNLMQGSVFETKMTINIVEINAPELKTIFENDSYLIKAINLEHSIPCLGYRLERKEKIKILRNKLPKNIPGPLIGQLQKSEFIEFEGEKFFAKDYTIIKPSRSVSFIFDTKLTDACFDLAESCNLLISEAVYTSEHENKAEEYNHLTARQVANIASQSGVEELILTHFSQRYKDINVLETDAKELFDNVICAYDFMKVEFKF